jgi:hypothetical protein
MKGTPGRRLYASGGLASGGLGGRSPDRDGGGQRFPGQMRHIPGNRCVLVVGWPVDLERASSDPSTVDESREAQDLSALSRV